MTIFRGCATVALLHKGIVVSHTSVSGSATPRRTLLPGSLLCELSNFLAQFPQSLVSSRFQNAASFQCGDTSAVIINRQRGDCFLWLCCVDLATACSKVLHRASVHTVSAGEFYIFYRTVQLPGTGF